MKISRAWLQQFFDAPLPAAQALADALTFHAFEIESVEAVGDDAVLDVKITPNRGHDSLSHRTIAKELAAILNIKMKSDPLRAPVSLEPAGGDVSVTINTELCDRFTGCHIRGVRVGPSPEWLKKDLETIGQRPINNIVDATNYVMFNIGQPLHAFDVGRLKDKNGYALTVRAGKAGETLLGLDDKEYELTPSMLVIEDTNAGCAVSIAGIKGGKPTGIDEATTDIFLEAANWDGVTTRRTSQALKLRTDASDRFQQVISPEMAAYGIRAAVDLIVRIAGGDIQGYIDVYPRPQGKRDVSVSVAHVNRVLGTEFSDGDIADVFRRLDLPFTQAGSDFTVHVPFERLDIAIPEDLVEEVGRIIGYDRVPALEMGTLPSTPSVNPMFYAAEKKREELMAAGYSEVYTSVFTEKGDQAVLNKVGGERPFLRTTLTAGLADAYERNTHQRDLLGLNDVKLFEIGIVWNADKEIAMVGKADKGGITEAPLLPLASHAYDESSISTTLRYKPFSRYPFLVRDIALWTPLSTKPEAVLAVIREQAGPLLARSELFDRFEKGERVSYAFRLVFQSFEKTLTDEEANTVMGRITDAVKVKGWEVR